MCSGFITTQYCSYVLTSTSQKLGWLKKKKKISEWISIIYSLAQKTKIQSEQVCTLYCRDTLRTVNVNNDYWSYKLFKRVNMQIWCHMCSYTLLFIVIVTKTFIKTLQLNSYKSLNEFNIILKGYKGTIQ